MNETMSGTSPWRVTFEDGKAVMIEIWQPEPGSENQTYMTFGQRRQIAPCASCGKPIPTITTDNAEQDLCQHCRDLIMYGIG